MPRSLASLCRRAVDQLVGAVGVRGLAMVVMMKVLVFLNCPGSCAFFKGAVIAAEMKKKARRKPITGRGRAEPSAFVVERVEGVAKGLKSCQVLLTLKSVIVSTDLVVHALEPIRHFYHVVVDKFHRFSAMWLCMLIHYLDTTIGRGCGENGMKFSEVARVADVTGGRWVRQENLKARRR